MARKTLRSVAADEVAARPKSITEAADDGTTRELLVAMRTRIATAVENPDTPARDLAALSKRLIEVARDVEAIDAREAHDATDTARPVAATFNAAAI